VVLEGLEGALLRACDEIRSAEELVTMAAEGSSATSSRRAVDRALRALGRRGLMVGEDDHYLSLPVLVADCGEGDALPAISARVGTESRPPLNPVEVRLRRLESTRLREALRTPVAAGDG
jgi:hypothetical protein